MRQRAGCLCEYCHASEQWQNVQFKVDHVVPLSLSGVDDLEHLALACFLCNCRKTNCLTAMGRATIATLVLNRERVINIREADKAMGRLPPADNLIQFRANESR